jgi:signal peptidase I
MKVSQLQKWTKLIAYTISVSVISALVWLNLFSQFLLVTVTGNSMEPTYKNGSWHLANKKSRQLQRDDVIVFKIKNETYIKRIVALPNDEIPVCYGIDEGQLYASIVKMEIVWMGYPHEWIQIPLDYIWVEGDAKNNMSTGSGYIGLVHVKDIIGVMNYTEPPEVFWYKSVVNQRRVKTPERFKKKHA